MKYLKHILLCCSFFILLLCLIPAQAQASKYTYNIEKYDVSIRVTPQNTYGTMEAVLPYTPVSLALTVEKTTIPQAGKAIISSSRSAMKTLH